MKYEHEEDIKGSIDNIDFAKEVDEIYKKAKKWDNYMSQIEEYAQGLREIDDMIKNKNKISGWQGNRKYVILR